MKSKNPVLIVVGWILPSDSFLDMPDIHKLSESLKKDKNLIGTTSSDTITCLSIMHHDNLIESNLFKDFEIPKIIPKIYQ